MIKKGSRFYERFVLYILLIGLLIGLLASHVFDEQKRYRKELLQEMDSLSFRANQTLQIERTVIEATALNLGVKSKADNSTTSILSSLKPLIDRHVYDFTMFIEPNTVLNGKSHIDPSNFIKTAKKKYGEKVYVGQPYYDSERKSLKLPIGMYFNLGHDGHRSILLSEIDYNGLTRDFTRLYSKRGGQGFLRDSDGNLINLSINASLSTYISQLAHELADQKMTGQHNDFSYKDHQVIIRTLTATDIKLIYIERTPPFFKLNNAHVIILMAIIILLLVFGVQTCYVSRVKSNQKDLGALVVNEGQSDSVNLRYDWLDPEAKQFRFLIGCKHASELINFKMTCCARRVSGLPMDNLYIASADYVEWISEETSDTEGLIQFEQLDKYATFPMTPGMVFCGVGVIQYLFSSQFHGKIHLICDQVNQLLVFNCFHSEVEAARITDQILPQDLINDLNLYAVDAYVMTLGVKVIIGFKNKVEEGISTHSMDTKKSMYPDSVIVYEDELEQNAILKFYLEHLKIKYKTVVSLKDVPDQSVVLITESMYLSLLKANQLGITMPYRFIICGDVTLINNIEMPTISRPYAIDKVAYALSRVMSKQASIGDHS